MRPAAVLVEEHDEAVAEIVGGDRPSRACLGGFEHHGSSLRPRVRREPPALPAILPCGDHLADDDQHRAGQLGPRGELRQFVEPAGIGAAIGARGVLDDGDRRRGAAGRPRSAAPRPWRRRCGPCRRRPSRRRAQGRPSRAASRRRRRGRWRRPAPRTESRSVSGISVSAAAANAAVMPGTMSKEMPAARSAAISSPARPKISGSPDFRRTTRLPGRASRTRSALISSWVDGVVALGLADIDAARRRGGPARRPRPAPAGRRR